MAYLSQRYHVVVTNPPYMRGNANDKLAAFSAGSYPNSKADLCTMFIERNLQMVMKQGYVSMITMQSWMFLSSYEKLRKSLMKNTTIFSMAHLGTRAFDSIGGEVVSTTAFVLEGNKHIDKQGTFLRLVDGKSEEEKIQDFKEALSNPNCGWLFRASADEFKKIPRSPIAYWVARSLTKTFADNNQLGDYTRIAKGLVTANNQKFVRFWNEVSFSSIGFNLTRTNAKHSQKKWFPYAKGGEFRKWFGNTDSVVNWENDGMGIRSELTSDGSRVRATNFNLDRIFQQGISWTVVTAGKPSFRYVPQGFLFDAAAGICQMKLETLYPVISYLNTGFVQILLDAINPTLNLHPGYLEILPFSFGKSKSLFSDSLIMISKSDWDSFETSWEFNFHPLLDVSYRNNTLSATYNSIRVHWNDTTLKMQRLEEKNNRFFIEAYGLKDELCPDVPLEEITLICNPRYRYSESKTDEELEELLLADTMKEFISYAVGCMFGRYSLDKPGLILANQGEGYKDYKRLVPNSSFSADKNNAIPIVDGDWFADDIVSRFRRFLRITFGESNFEENLQFIEQALGKDIRQYFHRDFYNDHVRRYKKRPIYWMFSSPDGSFNVLTYMHRYNPDTVSIVRNEYLREFMSKLTGHIMNLQESETNADLTKGERTRALKEIDRLRKIYDGLEKYERDILFPLATQRIEIDLDDGVKVNYPKFGEALKRIPGL